MGGDKKPSLRVLPVRARQDGARRGDARRDETVRRVLRTTADDLLELSWAGTHGAVASGMQSVAFTPAVGDRGDLRLRRARTSAWSATSSMAHGTARRVEDGGLHARSASGARGRHRRRRHDAARTPRDWLALLGCAGTGKVHRFAQIVAAAALALEISASSAMATAGSENFFKAHHERGGLR